MDGWIDGLKETAVRDRSGSRIKHGRSEAVEAIDEPSQEGLTDHGRWNNKPLIRKVPSLAVTRDLKSLTSY
jgi:hypothetical protein